MQWIRWRHKIPYPASYARDDELTRRDGLQWPHRDGLKWPHFALVGLLV